MRLIWVYWRERPGLGVQLPPQLGGHAPFGIDIAGGTRTAGAGAGVAERFIGVGAERHDGEDALPATGELLDQAGQPGSGVLGATVAGAHGALGPGVVGAVGHLLGDAETARGLALRGLPLGREQAVPDLADHDDTEQQHHGQRHQQRGRHHAELDIAPPQAQGGQQRPPHPAAEEPDQRVDRPAHRAIGQQLPAAQQSSDQSPRKGHITRRVDGSPPLSLRGRTVPGHLSWARPCSRPRARSPRSPAAPGPSRPWSAAAARGH